jgi:hypothetical protein
MFNKYFLIGVYTEDDAAHKAVKAVVDAGCPMDQLSVLGRLQVEGDDVLGVVHPGIGERMQVWGAHGTFWGAMAGLLAGASGVFWFPTLGPIMVLGYAVGVLTTGAAGAVIGGVGLAGSAAASQLSVLLHRHGLPESALDDLHKRIESGRYLVIIQAAKADERDSYRDALAKGKAEEVIALP